MSNKQQFNHNINKAQRQRIANKQTMIYTLEVHELLNKNNDVIGAEAMVFQRTDDYELKDCMAEQEVFLEGNDFDDIEDRNYLVEEEFDNLEKANNSFKFEVINLKNYLT